MIMKEKVENIIGGFLERNKQYVIEVYISNAITGNRIGQITITTDEIWEFKTDNEQFIFEWDVDNESKCNAFSFQYDEIIDCYKGNHEEENIKIGETIVIILKNGMKFEFECCGL